MSGLQRTLGPVMIWGLGVGYVISGAYFGWNLGLPVGGPLGLLVATVVATVLYVCFVLGYAELACALPKAGGGFVYARRAFGPRIAFLAGFAQVIEYALAPPAIAFSIGSYIHTVAPSVPVLTSALCAYVVFTAVNILGVRLSALFELVVTVLAVLELVIFGAIALPSFSWANFTRDAFPADMPTVGGIPPVVVGAFLSLPFAIWFYLAIEGVANVAEEAKDPQRDLSRGFVSAMATLVVLALVALLGAVGVAGWKAVVYVDGTGGATSDSPLPLAIQQIVGADHPLFRILTGVGLLGLVASFHGILIAASRSIFEFGRVGWGPSLLARTHARFGTPVAALALNFVVGVVALFTGRTADVILLSIFGALTLYIISMAALLRLRAREPDLVRPYRAPLVPWTPAIAIALSVLALVAMSTTNPTLAGLYVALLVAGYALWIVLVPRNKRAPDAVESAPTRS